MPPTDDDRRTRSTVVAVLVVLVGVGVVAVRLLGSTVILNERCMATVGDETHSLAPDQAANAATIAAVAVQRGLPARAATIGIATAVQESKLRNLDYGDRDSLGLFQQRPSQGWGTPEQVQDPVYATNAFYDVLVEIEGYRDLDVTDAAQQVQRSAFPSAYADHEPEGRVFASALTGYSPAALTCRLRPVDDDASSDSSAVAAALADQLGVTDATVEDGVVRVPADEDEAGRRRAWAVAQWAVASADAYGIVAVEVGDQRWERRDPSAGWTTGDAERTDGVRIDVAPPAASSS